MGVVPIATNRLSVSLQNPVAGARYLRSIVDGFVKKYFVSTEKLNDHIREVEYLALLNGFFHSVEETGRKQLHVHGEVRAANGPKALKEVEHLQKNAEEAHKVCEFAYSLLSAELPKDQEAEKFTACYDVELVSSDTVPASARFMEVREAYMYHCPSCNKQFTALLLSQLKLQRLKQELEVDIRVTSEESSTFDEDVDNDSYFRALLLGCGRIHIPKSVNQQREQVDLLMKPYKYILARIANIVQKHSTSLHSSCAKGSKRTALANQCRFGRPADMAVKTSLDERTGKVVLKRSASNIFVNPFLEVILPVLKANHDFQLLFGMGGAISLYKVVGYITITQGRVDHYQVLALARALQRRKSKSN